MTSVAGLVLTLAMFLAGVIFWTGHLSARVQELERWRENMRHDMHEISDKLEGIGTQLQHIVTLVEERTERRNSPR